MSEQASFVQDGFDRLEDAYRSIEESVETLQKDLDKRRKKIEKQLTSNRKNFEKRMDTNRKRFEKETRKQVAELRKRPLVKKALSFQKDASKQVEERVDAFLEIFNIASQSDLKKVDRKLAQISRKLRELEKAKAAGSAKSASSTRSQAVN